ncbi:MAG: right-handed parallel beta-helix repeat-containing protein [Burkholderiaceae bacterium]
MSRSFLTLRARWGALFTGAMLTLLALSPAPAWATHTVRVSDPFEITDALDEAARSNDPVIIELADGVYQLRATLQVRSAGVSLRSASGDPRKVIIEGDRMAEDALIGNLIWVGASDFTLSGITLRRAGNHLVQVAGELDVNRVVLENCVLQDSYQQMVKVSRDEGSRPDSYSDDGRIEGCEFSYTAGIAPQYYVGGIDAHGARRWVVRNNVFRDIASPKGEIAEYAIHFWDASSDTLVEHNTIIDCDRGIGFGLHGRPHSGGIIRRNLVLHADNGDPFADTGISLIDAGGAVVQGNKIFLAHEYPWAIELREPLTRNVLVIDNIANRPIQTSPGQGHRLVDNRADRSVPIPEQWLKR